jgi:hypothetical protein
MCEAVCEKEMRIIGISAIGLCALTMLQQTVIAAVPPVPNRMKAPILRIDQTTMELTVRVAGAIWRYSILGKWRAPAALACEYLEQHIGDGVSRIDLAERAMDYARREISNPEDVIDTNEHGDMLSGLEARERYREMLNVELEKARILTASYVNTLVPETPNERTRAGVDRYEMRAALIGEPRTYKSSYAIRATGASGDEAVLPLRVLEARWTKIPTVDKNDEFTPEACARRCAKRKGRLPQFASEPQPTGTEPESGDQEATVELVTRQVQIAQKIARNDARDIYTTEGNYLGQTPPIHRDIERLILGSQWNPPSPGKIMRVLFRLACRLKAFNPRLSEREAAEAAFTRVFMLFSNLVDFDKRKLFIESLVYHMKSSRAWEILLPGATEEGRTAVRATLQIAERFDPVACQDRQYVSIELCPTTDSRQPDGDKSAFPYIISPGYQYIPPQGPITLGEWRQDRWARKTESALLNKVRNLMPPSYEPMWILTSRGLTGTIPARNARKWTPINLDVWNEVCVVIDYKNPADVMAARRISRVRKLKREDDILLEASPVKAQEIRALHKRIPRSFLTKYNQAARYVVEGALRQHIGWTPEAIERANAGSLSEMNLLSICEDLAYKLPEWKFWLLRRALIAIAREASAQ